MTTVDVARMAEAQAREAMGEVETMATKAAAKVGTIRDIMRGHPGKREAMCYLSRIVNGHCMVEDVPLEHRGVVLRAHALILARTPTAGQPGPPRHRTARPWSPFERGGELYYLTLDGLHEDEDEDEDG